MRTTWLTSFDDNALLVKSLQHVLKHFSTTVAYIRKKSCICHIRLRFERDFKQEKYNAPASFQWFCSFALALRCWSLKNPCQWRNVKRYLNEISTSGITCTCQQIALRYHPSSQNHDNWLFSCPRPTWPHFLAKRKKRQRYYISTDTRKSLILFQWVIKAWRCPSKKLYTVLKTDGSNQLDLWSLHRFCRKIYHCEQSKINHARSPTSLL